MGNQKLSRLTHLTNEVEHLHPLLNQLLRKLPLIQNVEYTHGPDEMGADFVFSKIDKVLKDIQYVGVIAKIGKIMQDYSDIERQIEECAVPRTFLGGKERIRITEVWVIVTGNITQNAQDKIHDKYKLKDIHFIDGGRLESLIDDYLPIFWKDIPVAIGAYLSDQHSKVIALDRAMSLVPVGENSFYIEHDIEKFKPSTYKLGSDVAPENDSRSKLE